MKQRYYHYLNLENTEPAIYQNSLKSGHQLRNKRPNPGLGLHEAKGNRRQQRQATGHGSRRAPFRKLKWNGLAGFFLAV